MIGGEISNFPHGLPIVNVHSRRTCETKNNIGVLKRKTLLIDVEITQTGQDTTLDRSNSDVQEFFVDHTETRLA